MISLDQWAQIRFLRGQGLSIRKIAEEVGCAKKTVERALACDSPPGYSPRPARPTSFDAYEPAVRALLAESPQLNAKVIAQRVGWEGSESWFRKNVAKIRPEYLPPDPVDTLDHLPGYEIQCDLTFAPGGLPDDTGVRRTLPVLVMVASHSRFAGARILPSRTTDDLLAGMWDLLEHIFTAVPTRLVWDRESGIGRARLCEPVIAFAGALGCKIVQTPPRDPESKGIVERTNGYMKTSFFPARRFTSPKDVQTQLDDWFTTVANVRTHAVLKTSPAEAFTTDRAGMRPLPPYTPTFGTRPAVRLPRNYYVTVDTNHYSVDPAYVDRLVTVHTTLHHVTVTGPGGETIATHQRIWAKGRTITDPAHQAAAKVMRQQRATTPAPKPSFDIAAADLTVYDRITSSPAKRTTA